MSKSQFWTFFALTNILFIFTKIYQHNLYLNTIYKKQKLEVDKSSIQLAINELDRQFYTLKNKQLLANYATKELGMSSIKLSQIRTIQEQHAA